MKFTVRVENTTEPESFTASNGTKWSLAFSPGAAVVHTGRAPIFSEGKKDRGKGLEAQSEDGNPALLGDVNCVSAVRVEYSVPEGLHREILFVYDLWLPADFKPVNQDGEVAEIRLMPVEDVIQEILAGSVTLDAGAVMIDGLLRLGAMPPEDPQYLDLLRMLKP